MAHRKHGLGLLGLLVIAGLGVMAFAATAAQAEGEFLILNLTFSQLKITEETATGEQETEGTLLVPKLNLEIKCPTLEVLEGKVFALKAHLKLLYKGCKAFEISAPLAEIATCHVSDPNSPSNLHITANAVVEPVKHNGETYVLAKPLTAGTPFATIKFLSGLGCPLPLTNNVTGSVAASITQTNVATQLLTLSEAIQKLLGDELKYGSQESHILGKATAKLTGADKEKIWGAHAF